MVLMPCGRDVWGLVGGGLVGGEGWGGEGAAYGRLGVAAYEAKAEVTLSLFCSYLFLSSLKVCT